MSIYAILSRRLLTVQSSVDAGLERKVPAKLQNGTNVKKYGGPVERGGC